MTRWKTIDPLPLGLALGLLGVGALAMTLVSLGADNVTYARAEWTARLSLVLAAPAIVLYALPGRLGPWWRAFWTAGMLAYLLHFWWAVFGVFQGDVGVIYERQGFVAVTNALLTVLWIADVVVAWVRPWSPALWAVILRTVTWALVAVSFFLAAAVFRDEMLPKVLGILLAVGVVVAWLSPKLSAVSRPSS
jgi:hypothetical protein